MKEFEGRLTLKAYTSTLRSERSFMAETGEGQVPKVESTRPTSKGLGEIKATKTRLTPKEAKKIYGPLIRAEKDPDAISTLRLMQEAGIAPFSGAEDVPPAPPAPPGDGEPPDEGRPEGFFNPDNFENTRLKSVARRMQAFQPSRYGSGALQSRMEEITALIASGDLSEQDILGAEQMLSGIEAVRFEMEQAIRRRAAEPVAENVTAEERALIDSYRLYLEPQDILMLSRDPIKWLDEQFDVLYKFAKEGQELTSPIISQFQGTVGYAVRLLLHHRRDQLEQFQTLFTQRLKLMTMRTYIGYRAIGEVKNAAIQLGAHGLLSGFGMEGGKVVPMFNRLNEILDDERLKTAAAGLQFGHVTPEIANQLQDKVIQEQVRLAELGVGEFGDLRPERLANLTIPEGEDPEEFRAAYREKINADIVRSVRIAYDVFVNTQRQAVIVARGRHLYGTENYFSDPASGPLNVYNFEDLLTEKFDLFNRPEYEFLNEIKLDLADGYIRKKRAQKTLTIEDVRDLKRLRESKDERLELGKRLFRDLFAVPDFFSSGWRIKGTLDSIEERYIARFVDPNTDEETRIRQLDITKDRARNMALFLRLKGSGSDEPWQITKQDAWERVAKYRPEDVVRLFRERAQGDAGLEGRLTALFDNPIFAASGVANYDQFKEKYGPILSVIRDRGYKEFRPIDIAQDGFTQDEFTQGRFIQGERGIIERYFLGNATEADNLIQMFGLMTEFSKNSINDLLTNNKFEDIYTRTLDTNDAILNELEKTEVGTIYADQNGNPIIKRGLAKLSDKWAADQGGDALNRNWADTENAVKAGESLMHFIKAEDQKEKLKAALEFADSTSRYTSQLQLAKCLRYTFGTFLITSKKDFGWDVIGLDKLPFRQPMSDIERIYGPSAVPKSRDELRHIIDEISSRLEGSINKATREGRISDDDLLEIRLRGITEKEFKEERYIKILKEAKEFETDLIAQTENTVNDYIKRKGLSILFYLLLAVLGETQRTLREAAKEAA